MAAGRVKYGWWTTTQARPDTGAPATLPYIVLTRLDQRFLTTGLEDTFARIVRATGGAGDLAEGAEHVPFKAEVIEARATATQVFSHLELLVGIQLAVEELI
jgi:hypothetical protein